MPEITFIIKNKVGLHARPASLFVREAAKYKSTIMVYNGENKANAKSILNVLTLGANLGDILRVTAEGEDADAALKALAYLNAGNYGEAE